MARKLPSIFDRFPPGVPASADDLEKAMEADHERRTLAALDRAAGAKPAPAGGDEEGDARADAE